MGNSGRHMYELQDLREENTRLRAENERLKAENERIINNINELEPDDYQNTTLESVLLRTVNLLKKDVKALEVLLASGLLLKRHGADEVPRCSADIVGRVIIAELRDGIIVEAMWLKSKPDFVSRNGVDIPFSELKCWYANDGEME